MFVRFALVMALCSAPVSATAQNQTLAPSNHLHAFSLEHCMQRFANDAALPARQVPKFCGCLNLKTKELVPKHLYMPILIGLMQGKSLSPNDAAVIDGLARQCRSEAVQ